MVTISLCMIVKNEEDVLKRCLDSVGDIADEIIIADTGSSDQTMEIARSYTQQVYSFPWVEDFSAARNFTFSKATMEYCMWLDADDVLEETDRQAFLKLKEHLSPDTDVVLCRYNAGLDENGRVTFSYYRERIIRRAAGLVWQGAVHEVIAPCGTLLYADAAVTHKKEHPSDADRNLRIYEHQLNMGKTLEPRGQFYYARELYYHGRDEEAIRVLETFLSSGLGWVENCIEACRLLAQCHYRRGESGEALRALLRGLEFDLPRAELCCDIGLHFLNREKYKESAFWYELALTRERNDYSGAFVSPDCYGYLPAIQLAVCYDRLGDTQKAVLYNERAGACRPDSAAYQFNKAYFERLT